MRIALLALAGILAAAPGARADDTFEVGKTYPLASPNGTYGCDRISTSELAWRVLRTHSKEIVDDFVENVAHGDERCRLFDVPVKIIIADEGNIGWVCVSDGRTVPHDSVCYFIPTRHLKQE